MSTTSLRPEEITGIIKDRIENFQAKLDVNEIGTVLTIGDGVARVFGLKNVMAGELVEFDSGVKGMVLNLETNNVGIAVLGEGESKKVQQLKELKKLLRFQLVMLF
jgi:F-type H+-transporting ATPase subunit alpha